VDKDLWILIWRSQPWMGDRSEIKTFVGHRLDVSARSIKDSENGCGHLFCGSMELFQKKIKQEMTSDDGVSFREVCT
jgi:hypothetical protein